MQLAFDQVSFTYDASLAHEEKKRAKKAAKQRDAASNAAKHQLHRERG